MRRWEADLARPRLDDLLRLSSIYGVTALEEQFILTAASGAATELPPDPEAFFKEATDALSVDVPACLLDSLFYIRAWNSYAWELEQPPAVRTPEVHPLASALNPAAVSQWNEADESSSHRAWRRVQEFWLRTARLCGSDAYKRLLSELAAESPVFRERWLASDQMPADLSRPVGTTYYINDQRGRYRLVPLTIMLPPEYYLRLYTPDDEATEQAMAAVRAKGPPAVHFAPLPHWSLQAESSAVSPG